MIDYGLYPEEIFTDNLISTDTFIYRHLISTDTFIYRYIYFYRHIYFYRYI